MVINSGRQMLWQAVVRQWLAGLPPRCCRCTARICAEWGILPCRANTSAHLPVKGAAGGAQRVPLTGKGAALVQWRTREMTIVGNGCEGLPLLQRQRRCLRGVYERSEDTPRRQGAGIGIA